MNRHQNKNSRRQTTQNPQAPNQNEHQPRYSTSSSDYDRHADDRYQGVNYGRNHQEQNERSSIASYRNQDNPQYQSSYPSTERFSRSDADSSWLGNPARNADYGWNGEQESHFGKGPKGYRRSDDRIREEVSEALTDAHEVDASEIEVQVNEGIVSLNGSVPERQMKRAAEETIENLSGVKDVRNNLNVSSSASSASGLSTDGLQ